MNSLYWFKSFLKIFSVVNILKVCVQGLQLSAGTKPLFPIISILFFFSRTVELSIAFGYDFIKFYKI